MAKKPYHTPNMGSSPLDAIANASAAVQDLWNKIKGRKPMSPQDYARFKKEQVLQAAAKKIGVTPRMCKHKGVKRGSVCNGCGSKIW